MGYSLGIDVGTTFTAAATCKDGRAEIADLGERASAIPSVLLLKSDETFLVGVAAERRATTEPDRVAREFKRRFGDTTPIFLGGSPFSAEALTAKLLAWTHEAVVSVEGHEPDAITITHPANWGPYKRELLDQAVNLANLPAASTLTEPEAAANFYAAEERVEPGEVVAVYDLGGGTFDAAVLERSEQGFAILGRPEGIERLGGIDLDAAVYRHVQSALGGEMDDLDPDDPATVAAVARLRLDCVEAKEALSTDTDTSIPVMLPAVRTEVRLTRSEFEDQIRPTITQTIDAMRRAVASADRSMEEVATILLVGGSSRIPLVSEMVGAAFGRPLSVDAHPKHSVALGAALSAGGSEHAATPTRSQKESTADPPARKSRRPLLVGAGVIVALVIAVGVAALALSDPGGGSEDVSPAEPPPAACGSVITADFTVTEELTNCPGDGLVIAGDGVTVDLAEHTLTGTGAEDSVGIRINGLSDVTVRNGSLEGFAMGLVVDGGGNIRIEDVVSAENVVWGLLVTGKATDVEVADSRFVGNGSEGVLFDAGTTFVMSDNLVEGNTGPGVALRGADGTLAGGTIRDNLDDGVFLSGGTVALGGNTASRNEGLGYNFGDGVSVTDSGGNTATDNVAGACSPQCPIGLG